MFSFDLLSFSAFHSGKLLIAADSIAFMYQLNSEYRRMEQSNNVSKHRAARFWKAKVPNMPKELYSEPMYSASAHTELTCRLQGVFLAKKTEGKSLLLSLIFFYLFANTWAYLVYYIFRSLWLT